MIKKIIHKPQSDTIINKGTDDDQLMHFPCDFALKVMGENLNNYADYVLSICQKHVDGVTKSCVHTRPSRNGKYIAVTVQLIATSRKQLDDLYIELNNYTHTKMALQIIDSNSLIIRHLGLQPYEPIWQKMLSFTENRTADTADEIWLLEHQPVFTLGRNTKEEHILSSSDIPMIKIDRGGQVTYHGPGQLIAYVLIDLKRRSLGVRKLVSIMENSIIDTLQEYQLDAYAKSDAPGVYIEKAKIAAVGLRIKKGCSFHGLSLNLKMDLTPFQQINPCGYPDLKIIQLSDLISDFDPSIIQQKLLSHLTQKL